MTDLTGPGDVPTEVRDHHRWLSETDWRFRLAAFERPELRDPTQFAELYSYALGDEFGFENNPWPLFVDRARWHAMERDVVGFARLLIDVPHRVFGDDTGRLAAFYKTFKPQVMEILIAAPNAVDTAVSRGDFVFRDGRLRCLELNVSANCGGWESGELAQRYQENPRLRGFIDEIDLQVTDSDPMVGLLRHVIRSTRRHIADGSVEISGRLNLAMAYRKEPTFALDVPYRRWVREAFRREAAAVELEAELYLTPLADLEVRDGQVLLGNDRIHALMEDEIHVSPQIYRAFKAGRISLFNGPLEGILSDKRNMALLSEQAETSLYDDDERELVERVLPWTRILRPGSTTRGGRTRDLVRTVLEERESLVLKPAVGRAGQGVTFGNLTEPAAWRELVEDSLTGEDWIVQQWEPPTPLVFLQTGDDRQGHLRLHDAVYGLFVCGDHMPGGIMRYQVSDVGGAVNAARSATPGAILQVG